MTSLDLIMPSLSKAQPIRSPAGVYLVLAFRSMHLWSVRRKIHCYVVSQYLHDH